MLLFDGWACIHLIPAPTILDNLLAEDRIPPLIAIMPDSFSQEIRDRELACYPPFVDFLTEELMPWTRQHYHITSKPGDVIVGGSSLGGLAAAFAGYRRADMFGNVLSQSGSFGWKPDDDPQFEWLRRQFAVSPALPLQFYLDTGLLETIAWRSNRPSGLAANRHLRDVLQAKGYPVHYAEFSGGHDYLRLRGTLADGLIALTQPEHPDAK